MFFRQTTSMIFGYQLSTTATLARTIQSYARDQSLSKGKQLHANLIVRIIPVSTFLANHLLSMYFNCNDLRSASQVFDQMPHRNHFTWTAAISGYCRRGEFEKAVSTFSRMRTEGNEPPMEFAFSGAIQATACLQWLECGKQIHSLCVKCGCNQEVVVGSNLANLYSRCGDLMGSCRVFDEMPYKDVVSWTAMIDGYVKNGRFPEALVAFRKMVCGNGFFGALDQHVLCSAICACGGLHDWKEGLEK